MPVLTKAFKKTLIERVLEYTYGSQQKELDAVLTKLTADVYAEYIPASVQRVLSDVPIEYLVRRCWLNVFSDNGKCLIQLDFAENVTCSSNGGHLASPALQERIEAYCDDVRKLNFERRNLTVKLSALFNSVSTTNQLAQIWPESSVFMTDDERSGKKVAVNLPALCVSEINAEVFSMEVV